MNEMRKLMESIKNINEEIKQGLPGGRPFIDLSGPDGNAFVIMGRAKQYAKELGMDGEAIVAEMQTSDYENLLDVFDKYFGDYVDLYRGDSEEVIDEEFGTAPGARRMTNKVHEMMDDGVLDPRAVADAALRYMSEDDVADMANSNWEMFEEDDEFEESVEVVGEEPAGNESGEQKAIAFLLGIIRNEGNGSQSSTLSKQLDEFINDIKKGSLDLDTVGGNVYYATQNGNDMSYGDTDLSDYISDELYDYLGDDNPPDMWEKT